VTASLDRGRAVFSDLENINFSPSQIDSVTRKYHVRVKWLVPGSSESLEVENQMIEAYVIGAETGSTQDNIQKLHREAQSDDYDSLLYSRPVVTTQADGVINVDCLNIYLTKRILFYCWAETIGKNRPFISFFGLIYITHACVASKLSDDVDETARLHMGIDHGASYELETTFNQVLT
jgi:hypothetical protein